MSQDNSTSWDSSNKMHFFKKFIISFAVVFLLLISSAFAFYWFAGGSFEKPSASKAAWAVHDGGSKQDDYGNYPNKVNILVLGVDDRQDDVGRSDTIFVVMLDTKTKQVSLLSVPRDTRTLIPGLGWDKINHAYAHGGVKLSKRALEGLLGIPINYYACVNFKSFYKIIDSLGGVNIDVEKRMYYEDPYDDLVIDLYPGVQKLDGRRAIHYVRYRDGEGDIGRIARQQKFVSALMQQAASPLILTRLPSIIKDVSDSVNTDMTVSETVGLAKFLREAAESGLHTEMVKGTPTLIDGVDYWIPDIIGLRAHIAKIQGVSSDQRWLAAAKALASQNYSSIPDDAQFDEIPSWLTNFDYTPSVAKAAGKADDKARDTDAKDKDTDAKDKDTDAKNKNTDTKNKNTDTKNRDTNAKNKNTDAKNKDTDPKNSKLKQQEANASKQTVKPKQPDKSQPPDKPNQPSAASKPPASAKDGTSAEKTAGAKPPAAKPSGALRVSIINGSGSDAAADKMAAALRSRGFEVASVTNSANPYQNTVVTANTSDNSVTGKLTALPFRYALRINEDSARANLVTVIIGRDYLKQ